MGSAILIGLESSLVGHKLDPAESTKEGWYSSSSLSYGFSHLTALRLSIENQGDQIIAERKLNIWSIIRAARVVVKIASVRLRTSAFASVIFSSICSRSFNGDEASKPPTRRVPAADRAQVKFRSILSITGRAFFENAFAPHFSKSLSALTCAQMSCRSSLRHERNLRA
jgi:hypothetical protein